MRDLRPVLVALSLALALASGACGPMRHAGPPPIEKGTPCAGCGMDIADLRFAASREVGGRWLAYDAIECLLADRARRTGGPAWLSDYSTKTLRPEKELWVLRGNFPSPMGGGLAAFLVRAEAESLAFATDGVVAHLDDVPGFAVEGAAR